MDFRNWFLQEHSDSMEEFNEELGSESLNTFLEFNKNLPDVSDIEQNTVDEIAGEFIGTYCDYGNGTELINFLDPCLSKWRYMDSTDLVNDTMKPEIIKLWNYLVEGRSLKSDRSVYLWTDTYRIGFWSYGERKLLKKSLEESFGDLETIKQRYWTQKEKSEWQEALEEARLNNSVMGISGHNPVSTGIECVLQVLNDVDSNRGDIIIGIE